MMKRIPFNDLFQINANGSITPKVRIGIGGVTMGPGVSFGRGVSFSGIDLTLYIGRDFQVEETNGLYLIKGVYN